ncbi:MAG: M23 family metallopeptidase [Chloroflexota bacterium]
MSIQPLSTGDTSNEAAAASTAADRLVQENPTPAGLQSPTRSPITVAGSPGIMLEGVPGPPNVQIVLAHAGAIYDVVTFDRNTLQPDQQQALANLRFIPRVGSFPSAHPPVPRSVGVPPIHGGAVRPNSIPGSTHMYVFWNGNVNAGCHQNLPSGALQVTCGGNFYGQGDHVCVWNSYYKQNDCTNYDAIDWPLYSGNPVYAQRDGGATVKFAGWETQDFSGYGIWVVLDDQNGVVSFYAHLSGVNVNPGNTVFMNDVIGTSGCSGNNCSGAHVHAVWVMNPMWDNNQPFLATPEPQSPLYTYNSTYQPVEKGFSTAGGSLDGSETTRIGGTKAKWHRFWAMAARDSRMGIGSTSLPGVHDNKGDAQVDWQ